MCALYDVFDNSFVFQPYLWCRRTRIANAGKYSDPCDLDSGQSSSAHRNRPSLKDGSYSECLCVIVRRYRTKMEARKKVIVLQTVTFSVQVKVKFSRSKNS